MTGPREKEPKGLLTEKAGFRRKERLGKGKPMSWRSLR